MSQNDLQHDKQIDQDSIDPQTLFSQFAPTLFFDNPILREGDWYILAEQQVPATIDTFWKTIERWTVEPELVIPPVEKAKIISTTRTDKIKTVLRELVPKRKSKDTNLTEQISYFENELEARVEYKPMVAISLLPFYYPKVNSYSLVYQKKDEESGILRIEAIPYNIAQSNISPKQQYAMKSILHKLFKWCIQSRLGYKKRANHDALVSKEIYQATYLHLKSKYGPYLVENWIEKTDPKKFVFEDIAIASYLVCIWKEEEKKLKRKPTFVDLGCGNGLLTFLLVSEGYEGYGVDIAERKIWTMLCKNQKDMLRVEVLHPSQVTYPGVDWLIGNHADELVPWIPIIAFKSGEHCNFMVIPCCFYGLDGTKALNLNIIEGEGKYRAYTNYIKDVAEKSGFVCEEDYLRIPSTKNISIVGRDRSNKVDKSFLAEAEREVFVPRKTDREKEEERRESKRIKSLE